jgi:hypothetical protein
MAKATKIEQLEVTLTLTGEEAIFLRKMVGSVVGGGRGRQLTNSIFDALHDVLPQRQYGGSESVFAKETVLKEY